MRNLHNSNNLLHFYLPLFDFSQDSNTRKNVPQGLLYYYILRQKRSMKMSFKVWQVLPLSVCAPQTL